MVGIYVFGHKLHVGTTISWEAFVDPSDSYFLFAEERGYHKWALAHSSSCLNFTYLNSSIW